MVMQNARAAGGNALAYFRGKVRLDSRTNRTVNYTYQAVIYKCGGTDTPPS
jgi:hypothetical protein